MARVLIVLIGFTDRIMGGILKLGCLATIAFFVILAIGLWFSFSHIQTNAPKPAWAVKSQSKNSSPRDESVPIKMRNWEIALDGDAPFLVLTATKEGVDEFMADERRHDFDGIKAMINAGHAQFIPNHSAVSLVDYGFSKSKVRLTSGTLAGAVGFIDNDFLKERP